MILVTPSTLAFLTVNDLTSTAGGTPAPSDFSVAQAATQLGVHYMTAYRYVRLGQLKASKIGAEWRIASHDLEAFQQPSANTPKPMNHIADARSSLVSRLVAGDEAAAWAILEPVLQKNKDPEFVHVELIGPAMADIGELWAAGDLTIADEHRATSVARRLVGRSTPWFRGPGRRRGLVVVGAPASDLHSLPTALFADLVRAKGPDAIDLGAQTPAQTFVDIVAQRSSDLVVVVVVLVVTHDQSLDEARAVTSLLAASDLAVPVLVGGRAVPNAKLATELGATHWAATNDEAAILAASLVLPN